MEDQQQPQSAGTTTDTNTAEVPAPSQTSPSEDVNPDLALLPKIDLGNLDEILQTHAYDYQQATAKLPKLRFLMSEAKLNFDKTVSELYLIVRDEMEKNGEKPTEAKINAALLLQPDYTKAKQSEMFAKMAYDKVEHIREVFMQREQSIRHLVALHGQQYWSLHGVDKPGSTAGTGAANPNTDSKFQSRN